MNCTFPSASGGCQFVAPALAGIQVILSGEGDLDTIEIRVSSIGSDTANKSPFVISQNQLASTLLALLQAARMEVV